MCRGLSSEYEVEVARDARLYDIRLALGLVSKPAMIGKKRVMLVEVPARTTHPPVVQAETSNLLTATVCTTCRLCFRFSVDRVFFCSDLEGTFHIIKTLRWTWSVHGGTFHGRKSSALSCGPPPARGQSNATAATASSWCLRHGSSNSAPHGLKR